MMFYSIEEVTSLIGAHCYGDADSQISRLLTDSRSLTFPETTLFFALHSERNDGHKYIPQLYRRGVRNFVVKKLPENLSVYPGANFLLTPNPLTALQRLAERHREEFNLPVIGITGSNGKTMVKEWIYQLLSPSKAVTRSPRSYNSQIGVPLSVWLLDKHSQVGVFEAGISKPHEMEALQSIIQPTIGVLTNLGKTHQENFSSLEQKCMEKLQLFKDSNVIVYRSDDPLTDRCIKSLPDKHQLFSWSQKDSSAPLYIQEIRRETDHTEIEYVFNHATADFSIPFVDNASIENAIHCLAICLYLQMDSQTISERMNLLEPVAMRLEVNEGLSGCTLINDSYNSDLTSLDIALDFMNRRHAGQKRTFTLILSDMLQTGIEAETLYTDIAHLVSGQHINKIIGVGAAISKYITKFPMERHCFASTEALLASGFIDSLHNEIVLIKGARAFRFDKIFNQLSLKVHETMLEVNLNALVDNFNYYRSFLHPDTKITCMVKASAYGAGAIEVAKTLQDHQVDYLAVAVADEGAALRRGGITAGIMVMNPEMTSFKDLFEYDLEPEIYNFRLLNALIRAAEKEGVTNFPIHLKIDTGMHRLGFNIQEIDALVKRLKEQTAVVPRSVFSHFVGSDSRDFDDFTSRQFDIFDKATTHLQESFDYHILRHICNTAGIERFPQYQLDMVRLGLGLYGIDPFTDKMLHNVNTLRTTILQIRDVAAGDSVGYSRKETVERNSRIAAIPIGYADGLNRHLGCGKGFCLVNGKKAYYVGNICMDVCMIDVTDISCEEGDEAVIFGDKLPVTVLSDLLGTIPYEVLTSLGTRVKRVYYQD